jgi:hypothetical protein
LNRVGNPSERGYFYCVIPNAAGVNVTMYVYIGESFVLSSNASYIQAYIYSSATYRHHTFWYQHCWGELQSGVYCYCDWVN